MPKQKLQKTKDNNANFTYIEGSAVRKVANVPVRDPRFVEVPSRQRTSRAVKRNRQKALSMNGPYVAFLAVAAIACLIICTCYIMIQVDNMRMSDEIASLEKNVDTITSQNNAIDYSINGFIDVNHISTVATQELGMVRSSRENIELYESTSKEYINQYKDIPNN